MPFSLAVWITLFSYGYKGRKTPLESFALLKLKWNRSCTTLLEILAYAAFEKNHISFNIVKLVAAVDPIIF